MEDSIKAAVIFITPFWRNKDQSGTLFTNTEPIAEFYDHSNHDNSKFALGGFINAFYGKLTREERKEAILRQLKSTFGKEASEYLEYQEYNWREDKNTFIASNELLHPHQNNGHPIFKDNQFENRLLFSSTEVSPHFAGYMEGAVYMANDIAQRIKN